VRDSTLGSHSGRGGGRVENASESNVFTSNMYNYIKVIIIFFSLALQPSVGYGLVPRGFLITHNDATQSAGLLWTSDQLVAETFT
jgi:hypothetical protein